MSMLLCDGCKMPVDTDEDPDSLYIGEDECVCKSCRKVFYFFTKDGDQHAQ